MSNKKGQLLERPFIIIFTLVVAAFVFIAGFYLISNLVKTSSCSKLGLFYNDLNKEINRYYNFDQGSSTEFKYSLPKKIKYVCFFNNVEALDENEADKVGKELYDVMINTGDNLLFYPLNYCERSLFHVEKLRAKDNPICLLNTGKLSIMLENKGDYIEASKS